MAGFGPYSSGVSNSDVAQAYAKIIRESSHDENDVIDSRHIGSRFNEWRKPVADFGSNPAQWEVKLKASEYVGDIEFKRKDWARARAVVDGVLGLMLKETQAIAADIGGLVIERYVRQGSSREGLKVIAPDEFDTILQFHFEDLSFEPTELMKNGSLVNEFCYLKVKQSMETLQMRLPKLFKKGAFTDHKGGVVINARAMHTAVFASIIDQARDNVMKRVNECRESDGNLKLTRKINPPSINVTITGHFMGHGSVDIDLDIVPGLVIGNELVPDPSNPGQTMDCPVYAVFKWVEESSMKAEDFPKPDIVWRRSSSGVEKHTLDLVRFSSNRKQLYIITAMRVLKTYFVKTRQSTSTPPQITTIFKSYHLKQFAYYVILYTCYIYPGAKIHGVLDALKYFFALMRISLEKKRLPHFFHSNSYVTRMYPRYPTDPNQLRFNLLRNKTDEAINQALLSLDNHLMKDVGFTSDGDGYGCDVDTALEQTKESYSSGVSVGMFF